ncbi:MFS transporter [Halococcus thailandensis]|uniref:Major facilitator superfamily transporter n=1 Tax=Halococcus thailandensis JCM 13552 TaxID=1227457 RepID=M0N1M4_9EURY|nr:MFS transporter [Halococcus thailandensis]EMA50580.1 major facilitator superfamily transporter [Halococcus thailandensis JCM 13552]
MEASFESLRNRVRRTTRVLRGDGRGWTLAVVAAGWLTVLGGRYLFPAILPQVKEFFAVSNATAGVAVTTVWAAYALMQFPAGMLTDRFGERALLGTSLAVSAVAVVAVSLAPTFVLFLGGCALFGLGTGLYGPARGTALSATFGEHDGTAIGLTLAAGSVGSALLPFAASVLVGPLGWQTTVVLLAIPYLAVAIAIRRVLSRRTPTASPSGRPSIRGLLRALRTAVSRRTVTAVSAATLSLFVMQGLTSFLPTYFIAVKGFSQERAAALFALLFVGGALAQSVAGNAADYYGDRTVLLATAGFGVLPLLALPFVQGFVPVALLTILLGSRLAINPVSNAYIIAVVPSAVQGTAWGFFRTTFFLIAATGSTVVGLFFDAGLADESFVVLAALTALAVVCYVFLPERTRA